MDDEFSPHYPQQRKKRILANIFMIVMPLAAVVFLYALFVPITVLKNWEIVLPDGAEYKSGSTITVASRYTKTRNISGVAHRYVECQDKNGYYIRFDGTPPATADHQTGTGGTAVQIKLPDNPPTIPTYCHIAISIDYQLYSFRKINHYNQSPEFKIVK